MPLHPVVGGGVVTGAKHGVIAVAQGDGCIILGSRQKHGDTQALVNCNQPMPPAPIHSKVQPAGLHVVVVGVGVVVVVVVVVVPQHRPGAAPLPHRVCVRSPV